MRTRPDLDLPDVEILFAPLPVAWAGPMVRSAATHGGAQGSSQYDGAGVGRGHVVAQPPGVSDHLGNACSTQSQLHRSPGACSARAWRGQERGDPGEVDLIGVPAPVPEPVSSREAGRSRHGERANPDGITNKKGQHVSTQQDNPAATKHEAPALVNGDLVIPKGQLPVNQPYRDGSGKATLIFQGDGNLVDYDETDRARWAAGTDAGEQWGDQGRSCIFQADGNLVVYDDTNGAGSALWASGTNGHPDDILVVQDDGNVVIYDGSYAIWATGTNH